MKKIYILVGFLTKLDNGISAFKSGFNSGQPYYARLEDGTHTYNYETTQYGFLGLLGLGTEYNRPKENLKYYYTNTLFLQDCINLYADFASQVEIKEVDQDGNEIEDSEFVRFLNNPNPFQNRTEFIKEMVVNTLSSGASFQWGNFFKNGNLRINPVLYNLEYCTLSFPKIKDRYSLKKNDLQNLVIKETLGDSKPRNIPMSELAFFYDSIPYNGFSKDGYDEKSFFKPISRLFSILSSLNTLLNAQSSMEFMAGHNVNKVLSRKSNTNGLAPLDGSQKEDIERKVNGRSKYGAKANKIGDIIATNEDLQALDLTRDSRKMQLIEMKESAKEDIRNGLLIPKDFFGDSTYENKQFSEARFVLNQVKTLTDNWLNELENKSPLYFQDKKTRLVGLYDHLPSVIEAKSKIEAESFNNHTTALNNALNTYNLYKEVNNVSWDEFLRINQLNDYLMIEQ